MKTITTNKENWTGEMCNVDIDDDGTFTIGLGYTFKMTKREESLDGEYPMTFYDVTCLEEKNWEWTGFCFGGQVHFNDSVERCDENPYVAFARLAWNTI